MKSLKRLDLSLTTLILLLVNDNIQHKNLSKLLRILLLSSVIFYICPNITEAIYRLVEDDFTISYPLLFLRFLSLLNLETSAKQLLWKKPTIHIGFKLVESKSLKLLHHRAFMLKTEFKLE